MNLKFISVFFVIFSLSFSGHGYAKNACASVLCLSGMLTGDNPSECEQPIKDYFEIRKYKRGKWSAGRTANKRYDFLKQCPQGQVKIGVINATYGYIYGI